MKALGRQKNSRLNFDIQKKKDEVLQFLNVGVELLKCINQDLLERIFCIDKLIRRVVSHVKEKHSFALKRLSFAVKNSFTALTAKIHSKMAMTWKCKHSKHSMDFITSISNCSSPLITHTHVTISRLQ